MSNCSFCKAEVAEVNLHHLQLRICPKCHSVFFPCDQTMAFRGDLTDKSRELWLAALKRMNVQDPVCDNPCCIDHGEPLVDGKLPDYGFDGKVTACCRMYHMQPSVFMKLLKHTLDNPFQQNETKEAKHHFFFIKWFDSLVNKMMGEQQPEEDPLDFVQYNLNLKKHIEPDEVDG